MKFLILIIFSILSLQNLNAQVVHVRDTILMGSKFKITVVDKNIDSANLNINLAIDEIVRIENLISDWIPYSQVSQINTNSGVKPVRVDKEVFDLVSRAIKYSEITNGAFDISFAAMDKIWKYDGSMDSLPTPNEISNAIKNVGFENIILNTADTSVFLKKTGMKIGFGSIGKGYAADMALQILKNNKVNAAIVDASGDMASFGTQLNGKPWRIGVTNPFKSNLADIVSLTQGAITTSGDYQKFIFIKGIRYSHIINPKTGWPSTGLTSVTIVGKNAEIANALSTSIMVLGYKQGLKILKLFPEYGGLVITNSGKINKTKNYKQVVKKQKKSAN